MQKNKRDENIENVKNAGIDFITSITPALVSTYISNDSNIANATAAGAATLNLVLKKVLGDIANRELSPREQTKVGATYFYALEKISNYLNRGLSPRYADLSNSINTRSGVEEILEGILLKSRNEHEEKKLKILGNIYANTCFLDDVSFMYANIALNMATNMTYTKLCVLALLNKKFKINDRNLISYYFKTVLEKYTYQNVPPDLLFLFTEIKSLIDMNLIEQKAQENPQDSKILLEAVVLSGLPLIIPAQIKLSVFGQKLATILSLEDIPDSDLKSIYELLSEPNQVNV
jgi:hypothetical protein